MFDRANRIYVALVQGQMAMLISTPAFSCEHFVWDGKRNLIHVGSCHGNM